MLAEIKKLNLMKNLIKISFPKSNQDLLLDLNNNFPKIQIVEQRKLSGTEIVLLITAIFELTNTSLKIFQTLLKKYEDEKQTLIDITINGKKCKISEISKKGIKKKKNSR